MNKKLLILAAVILLGGGGAFLVHKQAGEVETGRAGRAALAEKKAAESGTSVSGGASRMYVDELDISQGQGGFLLWALTAERAVMPGEGAFQAEHPFLTYYIFDQAERKGAADAFTDDPLGATVPEGAAVVTVKSLVGAVDRPADLMRFERQVVMVSEDKTVLTERLEYSGAAKTLASPGPADFFGATMQGKAGSAFLDLTDSILYASDGVAVEWMLAPN